MRSLILLAVASAPILAVAAAGPSAAPRQPGFEMAEKGARLGAPDGAKTARVAFAPGGRIEG